MTIIKVEYDTEDPLCSIVKNLRLQAKQEVFDDIENNLIGECRLDTDIGIIIDEIRLRDKLDKSRKRHLSTFENKRDIIADKSNRQEP